jgi:hypothetical protein
MKNNKGFAAFILVVSISSLMLAFSFMQAIEYGHYFDAVQTKEYRLMSYYSAYSCIDQAFLALSHDYFFTTNIEIPIKDLNCVIKSVISQDDTRIISVYGKYKNIIVYRSAVAKLFDDQLEIVSIQ